MPTEAAPEDEQSRYHPNSAYYWFRRFEPVAAEYNVAMPETEFVEFDFAEAIAAVDGEGSLPVEAVQEAAMRIGYPVFVRTDLRSAKHAGPAGCRIDGPEDVDGTLVELVKANANHHAFPAGIMVREHLDLAARFTAHDGLPIAPELRVFASADGPQCHHFYWPREAFERDHVTPRDPDTGEALSDEEWRDRRRELRDQAVNAIDLPMLQYAAVGLALECSTGDDAAVARGTTWAVDFALTRTGKWHLIDAALAEDAWHPDHDGD